MESLSKITLEPKRLRLKMIQLKKEALFTDVTLCYYSKSLHVHKCILSASSLFFKILFTKTDEDTLRTFDLTQFILPEDSEMIESIVTFMYSGMICLCESNIVVISSLAKYFGIADLTSVCLTYLQKILTAENCLKFFCQIRCFEKELLALDNRVTIEREKDIETSVFEMVCSVFYKNSLIQDDALQLTTGDLQDIIKHASFKDFCVGRTTSFLVKWLKQHSDLDSIKTAEVLIQEAYDKTVSQNQPIFGNKSETSEDLDKLHLFLMSCELPEETTVKFQTQLNAIKEEIVKMIANGEMEIKQEFVAEPDVKGEEESMEQDNVEEQTNCYDDDTDEAEIESIKPANIKKTRVPIWKMKVKKRVYKSRKVKSTKKQIENENKTAAERRSTDDYNKSFMDKDWVGDYHSSDDNTESVKGSFTCKVCHKVFMKRKTLTLHQRCHAAKTLKCIVCGMKFGRNYHLVRHMTTIHADIETFECEECQDTYTEPKEFVRHLNSHRGKSDGIKDEGNKTDDELSEVVVLENGQKEFRCNLCEKTFSNNTHLKEHIMIHTGNRPYTCSRCDRKFKNNYEMKKHIKTVHLGEGSKFKCETCKQPFNLKEALDRHSEKCKGRSYHCETCGASFYRKYHLDRHISIHLEEKPYTCPHCSKSFKQEYKLKAHIQTHNEGGVEKQQVICELCGAVLKNVRYLKRHLQAHTGVKPHKCPVCNNSYSQAGSLQVHMRKHTGAKPFQCEICSMLFAVKSNLMRHQRRHRGDRRHKCDQCGKGFVMMGDLRRHYTIHTGEKNYACKYCGKKFSSKSKLPQHERIHTGEKPYECRVCGKRFIQSGDRYRHEAIHGLKPQKNKPQCLELAYLSPDMQKETPTDKNTQNNNTPNIRTTPNVDNTQNINTTQNIKNTQSINNSNTPISTGNENQPTDYSGNKGTDDGKAVSESFSQVPSTVGDIDKDRLYRSQLMMTGEPVQPIQANQEPVNSEIRRFLGAPFGARNLGVVSGAINASVAVSSIGTELNFMSSNLTVSQGNNDSLMNSFAYEY